MSELINNREHRRNVLKDLITQLHNGKSVEDVKQKFEETFGGVRRRKYPKSSRR